MGIKNSSKIYQAFIIAAFAMCTVLTIIFWIFCYSDFNDNKLLKNGIEVEAEIVDIREIDITPGDSYVTRAWVCVYLYVAPDNKEYSGTVGEFTQKEYAADHIGEKITIIIDPTDGYSTYGTLLSISHYQKAYHTHILLACVFTGLLCVSAYLFFYRVVYRNRLDKKINNTLKSRFVENSATQGEVIKIFGLLWFYVKVKYNDDKGLSHKKWARSWFTRKEAKYLKQKKYINIVPYKNTYGILEEIS